jgi:hypothetical protein
VDVNQTRTFDGCEYADIPTIIYDNVTLALEEARSTIEGGAFLS